MDHYQPAVHEALTALVMDRAGLVHRAVAHLSAPALGLAPPADDVAKAVPTDARQAAAEWLAEMARIDQAAMSKVLEGIRAAAAEVGANLSADAIPDGTVPDGATVVTDWSAWQPGDARAAGYGDLLGLRLESLDITIQGITDTTMDALGMLLGDGIAAGDSVQTIAAAIDGYFGDPARSVMIARTETCRAVSAAAEATYAANGVSTWTWEVGAGCCDLCQEFDGMEFPVEGDQEPPPLHPNCRCTPSPVVDVNGLETGEDVGEGSEG